MCPFSLITLGDFNKDIQISNLSLHCKFCNYQIIKTYTHIYIFIGSCYRGFKNLLKKRSFFFFTRKN